MYKQAAVIIILVIFAGCLTVALGQITVGVKEGDWIEYQVIVTGNPPEEHDVTSARIEVLSVQGSQIEVNLISEIRNGTIQVVPRTLNLEEGELGVWFIIPANLDVGDTFFDRNAPPPGIFTIQSVDEMRYANARRTVSFSPSYFEEYKRWDKTTGIFVEGLGVYDAYSINTIAMKTNMWNPQIFGIDSIIFYSIIIGAAIIVSITVLVLLIRKKK